MMIRNLQSVLTHSERYDWQVYGEIFLPVNREDCEGGYWVDNDFTVFRYKAYSVDEYWKVRAEVIQKWNELREKHSGLFVRRYPMLDFNVTEKTPEEFLPDKIEWIFSFRVLGKDLQSFRNDDINT